MDLALRDGVAQRPHDVLLADDLVEAPRAVAAVERRGIGHASRIASRALRRYGPPAMARIRFAAAVLLGAVALRLLTSNGLVNYDTLYSLVWGRELAHGALPDLEVAIAPTPHPLATLGGVLLSPLSSLESTGCTASSPRPPSWGSRTCRWRCSAGSSSRSGASGSTPRRASSPRRSS